MGNLKANANPSNPVGKRVHFVSTFCKSRDRSCDHRKLPSCFGGTKITQCTTQMENYFLKPRWKWNNGHSIVPVFLYNILKKILFRLFRMNLLLLRMGKCRHHLISRDLIWIKIVVWNYLQTKSVIISAIQFVVFINCISIELTIQLNS